MSRLVVPVIFITALLIIGVLIANSGSTTTSSKASLSTYAAHTDIPALSVKDSDNNDVLITKLPNKTLLTFWNSNCSECQTELTDLQKFTQTHSDFKVVLVNYAEDVKTATDALKKFNVTLPTYYDHDGSAYVKLAGTMPSSYFLENNQIVYYFPGRIDDTYLSQLVSQ